MEPGDLSPLAVAAMREVGIDISENSTRGVFDLFKAGRLYSHVVTVCDEAAADAIRNEVEKFCHALCTR